MTETGELSKLIANANQAALELQQTINNFKKSPKDRLNEDYIRNYKEKIEQLWLKFQQLDQRLRCDLPENHTYFQNDVYAKLGEVYNSIRDSMELQLSTLKQRSAAPTTSSTIHPQATPQPSLSTANSPKPVEYTQQLKLISNIQAQLKHALEARNRSSHFYSMTLQTVEQHWKHILQFHEKLMSVESYDLDEFLRIEQQINENIVDLQEMCMASAQSTSDATPSHTMKYVRLPAVELPKFNGNSSKWRQFRDLFLELVHSQSIPNCQKLWYLKTSLQGEADQLIKHLTATAENYDTAWQILEERYENKRLLVNATLTRLINQPSVHIDNASSIKSLHDTTQECLLSLKNLGINIDDWDPILLFLLIQKLSKNLHTQWETSLTQPRELPTIVEFLKFLNLRFQSLESVMYRQLKPAHDHDRKQGAYQSLTVTTPGGTCIMCKQDHALYKCHEFLKLLPPQRLNLVQKAHHCVNCLKAGHKSKNCTSSTCLKCKKKHNTLLHLETREIDSVGQAVDKHGEEHKIPVALTTTFKKEPRIQTLLSTVCLSVKNKRGEFIECRALLDNGSQVNLITKAFINKLGLRTNTRSLEIVGISDSQNYTSGRINVHISSVTTNFNCNIEAHILPTIVCNQPARQIDVRNWNIPKNIKLADPDFSQPRNIDLLLGAGIFYQILSIGQLSLGASLPVLQNSLFGWIIGGDYIEANNTLSPMVCGVLTENGSLEDKLEQFWKLEECEQRQDTMTAAERRCETQFIQTVRRSADGKYVVSLPFTKSANELGESRDIALHRFRAVERKLRCNPALKVEYVKFMQEYERLGHMSQIPNNHIANPHYFLPHHAVLKPDSTTTKLRVVFDASAKTSSNVSLNDILSKGPTIQDDVFSILVRFRLPLYAMTADVEKMYRQIWVREEDRNLQLIWWRENEEDSLKCYQLNTVTYGSSSAPFLAIRTLRAMADDMGNKFPLAADAIRKNFYVDDVLSGSDHLLEACELQTQLLNMFKAAGMNLRKWVTNHPKLLESIPPGDREKTMDLGSTDSKEVKTMGLRWEPNADMFKLKIGKVTTKTITKRTILSDVAQIFDPLGFLAPVIAAAKMLLQKLWKLKLDWDAAIPQELFSTWKQFREELQLLQQIGIPRHVFGNKTGLSFQTHIFCDASEQAYGAVAYIRTTQPHGVVTIRFLCAKSKVAPVKQISLPRLELCAAKLGADLFQKLMETEQFRSSQVFFWTDSTAVLGWIKAESANYHTFIANRIAAIQRISSPSTWRHVRSADNPADLISRGLLPSKLVDNNFWFYGPKFLHGSLSCWPLQPPSGPCDLELRKIDKPSVAIAVASMDILNSINHKNCFHFLKGVVATLLTFAHRSRGRVEMENEALIKIVMHMQTQHFNDDIQHLKKYGMVKVGSKISSLTPFLDENGVIRVGGRLEASKLSFNAKHPMLLPGHHEFTKLLLETIHRDNQHAGPQTLMALVRQQFWPINLKSVARTIVQSCVRCSRSKPKLMNQLMGDLPADRVQPARPFVVSGVDFFGPVWTHFKIRGKRPLKAYVAVFCCFATKAVHMELVSDLTTDAFLAALKRFIARRGHCQKIYCDNATNFVGAKNQIEELQKIIHSDTAQEKIQGECRRKCIEFLFIPPRAPHFGGLWEAAVKSAKKLLISTLSSAALTYEEMGTLITEAEAILNSRPLTPISSNPNDLQALTPGHFLIGEPMVSPIDPQYQPNTMNNQTRWKLVNQLKAEFWKRWHNEYLSTLQHRNKWKQEVRNIEPGTMVIIKEDNLPSMRWPLGRVVKAIPGPDGLVRVADVRTANNITRRPIHRLSPLPIDSHNNTELIDENETPLTSPKRRRLAFSPPVLSILAILFILPLCFCKPINVHPFITNPGIYYEKLGTAGMASSEWTLISYVNMKSYWEKYDQILKYPEALRKASNDSQNVIVKLTESLLGELRMQNQVLSAHSYKRYKRGAINIIGNIANSLFGILDENYAEQAEREIERVKENENYLIEQLRNQTSFLDASTTIFKKTQQELSHELQHVSTVLNSLNNKMQKEIAFTELAIQSVLDMMQFQRLQDSLREVLLSSHHGKLSPMLVSPMQLKAELEKIKANLPVHLRLPSTTDNLLKLYKLIRIGGRVRDNYIIFKLTLDLLSIEEYEVLNLIRVPWKSNQVVYQIQSQYKLLIINLHRDKYMPLKEAEIGNCDLIDDGYFICHQHHPLYKIGSEVASCEVKLLNHQTNSSCKVERIESRPYWIQLQDPNSWIFSVPNEYIVNSVCGVTPTQIRLQNSGIMHLRADCNIQQPEITIQGYQHLETQSNTFYIPNNDVEAFIDVPHLSTEKPHVDTVSAELAKLQQNLTKINLKFPHDVRPHDIHHYTMTYICLTTIIVVAWFVYWKFKTSNSECKEADSGTNVQNTSSKSEFSPDDEFVTISG